MLVEMVAITSIRVRLTMILSWATACLPATHLEVGHLEQEGEEADGDEDGLLEEDAKDVVLNLPETKLVEQRE